MLKYYFCCIILSIILQTSFHFQENAFFNTCSVQSFWFTINHCRKQTNQNHANTNLATSTFPARVTKPAYDWQQLKFYFNAIFRVMCGTERDIS